MQKHNFVVVSLPNSAAIWGGTTTLRIWKESYTHKAMDNDVHAEKSIIST